VTSVSPKSPLAGARVLIVDDDPDARELLSELVELAGARTWVAASAREALEALGVFHPDLLVSDISMPVEDGYALIAKIRARPDGVGKLPAVAVTAYVRQEDARRALDAGYQAHLPKPVDPDTLIESLVRLRLRSA
jgi:CheY-like chemotaxis protein